jgi:hypothetical protein
LNAGLRKFSHDQDIEVGAVKLSAYSLNIYILSIYRAPSGNFAHFLDKPEMILNLLHSNKTQLTIFGDINMNYTYLLTPWSRVLLEKLTSLCS